MLIEAKLFSSASGSSSNFWTYYAESRGAEGGREAAEDKLDCEMHKSTI